jgi:alpha-L-arabinofuranosidase
MKRNLIIMFVTLLFVIAFLLKANSQEATTVDIRNSKIKEIPYDMSFVGVNWQNYTEYNDTNDNTHIFENTEHIEAFIKALKDINIDMIRYPGGSIVSFNFWNVSDDVMLTGWGKWHERDKKIYFRKFLKPTDIVNFKEFVAFCKRGNLRATIQVNTHTYFDKTNIEVISLKEYTRDLSGEKIWDKGEVNWKIVEAAADEAAKQVTWAKNNGYSDIVKYWELGNEEYIRDTECPVFTGKEYGKIAAIFIKKMKAADPSIKILVTGIARVANPTEVPAYVNNAYVNVWNKDLLTTPELLSVKDQIFAFTTHAYPDGNSRNQTLFSTISENAYNNPNLDVTGRINFHKKILDENGYKNAVVFMNEFNSSNFKNIYTRSWVGSLGNAHVIMSCANAAACYHSDYYQMLNDYWVIDDVFSNKGMGMIHYSRYFPNPFILQSTAYVTGFLNDNLKGSVIKAEYNNPDLYITTVLQNDLLKVIILNKKEKNSAYLKLNDFKNYEYIQNKSIGVDIPDTFTTMQTGDSSSNPSEVAVINTLDDAIKVTKDKFNNYNVELPKNTITTLFFKKNDPDNKVK